MERFQGIELPTDEINVVKAEEVQAHIQSFQHDAATDTVAVSENVEANTLVDELSAKAIPLVGKAEVGQLYSYSDPTVAHPMDNVEPESVDPIPTFTEDQTASPQAVLAKSMTIVKELSDNPAIQAALEGKGLTVDVKKLLSDWQDATGFQSENAIIRPLTDEEKIQAEGTCACTDCVEETEPDVDTDTMLIVHDLSERLAALEERIALYNTKASHKI